jgi:proteasome activator subunit 3 (PA28 gamma)
MMPKIQDQKVLSSSVQEELLDMLNAGRANSMGVLDNSNKYWGARGKLISKVVRYPEVCDWLKSVEEVDDKEWAGLLAM